MTFDEWFEPRREELRPVWMGRVLRDLWETAQKEEREHCSLVLAMLGNHHCAAIVRAQGTPQVGAKEA